MSDEPLAVYRERLLNVRRTLTLYPDRVVAQAKWIFGGAFTQEIRLDTLAPDVRTFATRQRLFKRALAVASMCAAVAVVFTRPGASWTMPQWLAYTLYALALAVGAVAVIAWPKVLFARFPSRSGRPGLDVARAGPDARAFDDFVSQVQRQIRRA